MPTLTVHLPPEAYRKVTDAAKADGTDPDTFATVAVIEAASVTEAEAR